MRTYVYVTLDPQPEDHVLDTYTTRHTGERLYVVASPYPAPETTTRGW